LFKGENLSALRYPLLAVMRDAAPHTRFYLREIMRRLPADTLHSIDPCNADDALVKSAFLPKEILRRESRKCCREIFFGIVLNFFRVFTLSICVRHVGPLTNQMLISTFWGRQ
jgi:hypothetical protein